MQKLSLSYRSEKGFDVRDQVRADEQMPKLIEENILVADRSEWLIYAN